MPTSAPTAERYVEFDEFVDFQLHKTESAIKTADVLTAVVGVAAVVVGYLLAFVVLDHWVVPGGFGYFARAAMLGGVVLAAIGWVMWKVVLPARRRVNSLYAARAIERTAPEAKSTLLNLVDLRRSGRPVPPQIMGTLEKRAALMLSHVDVEQAVDRKLLMRLAYALLIVVVGFCMYTLFSPKKVSNSVWRALFPAAQVEVATQTRIVDVKPGDVEVLPGAQLEVLADLSGRDPEKVTLYFSTADRRVVDEPLEMQPVPDGVGRHRALLVGEAGRGIRQSMTYRVEAGDARSDTYRVTVLQPPSATVARIAYDYPEYMDVDPRSSEEPRIEAWEGTRVTLSATTNVPVEKAWIEFSDDEQFTHRGEEFRVEQVDGTSLRHTWTLELRPIDATPRSPKFYRIRVLTAKGERDPSPIVHGILIRPDDPPELRIVEPQDEEIEAAANAAVPLLAEARDDFAVRSVSLQLKHDGKQQPLDRALARHEKTNLFGHVLELDKLLPFELEAGSLIEYRVEARDNKPELGQAAFSEWRKIRITDEQLDPEKQEQQRQDARQQQRKQIDEAQQEAGDGQADREQQPQEANEQGDGQQDGQHNGQPGDPMNADGSGDAEQGGQRGGDPNAPPQPGDAEGDRPENGRPRNGQPPEGGEPSAQRGARGSDGAPQPQPLDADGSEDDAAIQRALDHLREQAKKQEQQRQERQPSSEPETERGPRQTNEDDPQQPPAPGKPNEDQSPQSPGGSERNPMPGAGSDSGDSSAEDSQPPGSRGGKPDPMSEPPDGDPNGNRGAGTTEGDQSPSNSDPSSEPPSARGAASGKETGPATADRRPDAEPVDAQNPLDRKDDEDPQTRPSNSENPERPANSRQGTGEPEADQPTRTEPNGTRQIGEERTDETPAADVPINENGSDVPRKDGVPEVDPEAASNNAGGQEADEDLPTAGKPSDNAGVERATPGDQADEGAGQPANRQPGATEQGAEEGNSEGESAPGSQPAGDARGRQGDAAGDSDRDGPVGGGQGGRPGSELAEGTPNNAPPSRPEDANLEYNKKAAELVLQRLEEQLARGDVDEELKKKLGWDEDQIRKFIERNKPLLADESPDDSSDLDRKRKRLEELLRGGRFDIDAPAASRTGQGVRQRDGDGFTPRQATPPPEYRPQYEEYLRRINRGADANR
ncbi:MAG: hypothetical protein WD066_05970 [Planctomycetaceae bacterium]